jgi:hypothetical protein
MDELQETEAAERDEVSERLSIEPRGQPPREASASRRVPAGRRARRRLLRLSLVLVPFAIVLGGVAGFVAASSTATTYRSEAIVVPSNPNVPVGQFPVLAQAVFRTDAVIQPIISKLALDVTPQELLSSGLLSIEEVPTGGAVSIDSVTRDPALSQNLANTAAHSLVDAMQSSNLGTISVFATDAPGEKQPKPVVAYAVAGAVTGLVVIIGLILAIKALTSLRSSLRASRGSVEPET